MKTVSLISSILFILLILLCYSCKDKTINIEKIKSDVSYVSFDTDTVVYSLYAKNYDAQDNFWVIRNLYVNDTSIGSYNEEKEREAIALYKNDDTVWLYLKYSVFLEENGKLLKLWDIKMPNADNIIYPVLEQCMIISEYKNSDGTNSYAPEYNCIKVKYKRNAYPDFQSLTFKINNDNSWKLLSKEKLNTTLPINNGYYVDTITKHLNNNETKNLIIFHQAFDNGIWEYVK